MMGTKVGVHTLKLRSRIPCWRCGLDRPRPDLEHVTPDAPCADCRYSMVETDGIPRSSWMTRESRARNEDAA